MRLSASRGRGEGAPISERSSIPVHVLHTAEDFVGTERFLVQRRLGAGAFGVVYEAYDRQEKCPVALKVLRIAEAEALYRFKKDFRSLADLRHPNLVAFYELLSEGGVWFFSMELIDGVDFVEHLTGLPSERSENGGRPPVALDWERVRRALLGLARGLHAVHRHGKVHRDVKPPNVLVTREGRVALLDFGLVAELEQSGVATTVAAQLVGTPAYMSPEQALALPGSPASDWYSVGVMLFQVLVGELPFRGSLAEILAGKQTAVPPSPGERVRGLPRDLDELCRGLLDPDPETRLTGEEVLQRLAGDGAVPPRARWRDPFVGRAAALAELRAALVASRDHTVCVDVRGASGIGKTALIERFADEAAAGAVGDGGAVVLTGRCYLQESVPYKALDSLIDSLSRHLMRLPAGEVEALLPDGAVALARLFPVLLRVEAVRTAREDEAAEPQAARRRAAAALKELLARLAAPRPLVLLLDDLQWGDVDSFLLLDELLKPPAPPLLLISAWRSEDAGRSPFLHALAEQREALRWRGVDVREVELGELSAEEARDLVRSLGQDGAAVPAEREAALVREAGGSPLFIAELARSSAGGAALPAAAAGAAPGRLRDVILGRVAELEPAARRLLEVVAVAGKPLDFEAARQAAAIESGSGQALAQLRARKLVRQAASADHTEIEAYHDRIRETVADSLTPAELRQIHRHLALALESSGRADPETLAIHFQATEEVDRARDYAVSAAERAEEALAFDRAARLYRLALELLPAASGDRYALQVKLGTALANAGRSREAAETYLRAVGESGKINPHEAQRHAALQLLISGHIDRGLAILRHVLRQVGMSLEPRSGKTLARLWLLRLRLRLRGFAFRERPAAECDAETLRRIDACWSVEIGLCLVDTLHAAEFHARHLLMALELGEPQRVARGLAMEVFFCHLEGGDPGAALALARELAGRVPGLYASCLVEMAAGMLACSRGEWRIAHTRLTQAEEHLREIRTGGAWELDTVRHFRVIALLNLGRLADLFAELPRLLEPAREQRDLYLEIHLCHWVECFRHLADDEPAAARRLLRRTRGGWSHEGFHFQHFGRLYAKVQTALYDGRGRAAWRRLDDRWRELTGSLIQRIEMVLVQSYDLRGRAALASAVDAGAARRVRRLRHVARAVRRLERAGSPWSLALAELLRAGALALRERREPALAALAAARHGFAVAGMPLHAAATRRRRGELLGDAGEVAAADRALHDLGVRNPERMAGVLAPGRWS